MRLLVIGGSDAGIAAALRARELDPSVEATVVVADAFTQDCLGLLQQLGVFPEREPVNWAGGRRAGDGSGRS